MSQEVFKQLMELMKLKKLLTKTTNTKKNYMRHPQGNVGIISFQEDPSGSNFTINVSTYSYALSEFF